MMVQLTFHSQGRNIFITNALVTSVFQVLLEEQIRGGSARCVLFGCHSEMRDAPVTLLIKSCTQWMLPLSPTSPPFVGHVQLSDYAGKTLCHEQPNNICKGSLWNPSHQLSKPKCALGSEVHSLEELTFSPIAFEFLFFI